MTAPVLPVESPSAPAPAVPVPPCPECPKCPSRGPSRLSRFGHAVLRELHGQGARQFEKKFLPMIVLRLVVAVGGSVQTADLVKAGLHALGVF